MGIWLKKHWEVLSYLIFGVLTTVLNLVLYALFHWLFGYEAANSWGNVLDNVLCILFAYATNRAFVFRSRTTGRDAVAEFGKFVTCRLGTMVLDVVIVFVCGNLLAAQGTALMGGLLERFLLLVSGHAEIAASSGAGAAIGIIGGADGPTAVFVTGRFDAQGLWGLCVKVFSNVLIIVLNYIFSKVIVFKKK